MLLLDKDVIDILRFVGSFELRRENVAEHDVVEEYFELTQREQKFVVAQVILAWLI
jgi:hypothetical protein